MTFYPYSVYDLEFSFNYLRSCILGFNLKNEEFSGANK